MDKNGPGVRQKMFVLEEKATKTSIFAFSLAVGLAALFGWLSHWKVFEYDLFFNVRAGKEILETWKIQKVDTWSHTVQGQRWLNFEWLSCVIQYLASRVQGGYVFSGWLRSFLIGFWIFSIARFTQKKCKSTYSHWILPLLLVPWIYVIAYFRLQMRPDLFATCHYILLFWIWNSNLSTQKKRTGSLVTLFSWANFHGGTAPIGIFFYSSLVLFGQNSITDKEKWLEKLKWLGAGALTWFLTPLGIYVLEPIWESLITYDHELWKNPDYQPFSLSLLTIRDGGWSLSLWVVYTLVGILSYFYLFSKKQNSLPSIYRNKWFVPFVGGAMTLLTFNKIRVIHYQSVLLLPIIAAALDALIENQRKPKKALVGLIAAGCFLWLIVLPDQVRFISKGIGDGLNEMELPIHTVEFIKKVRPEKNLLNAHPFGGYLIAELSDYPVSIDGRGPYTEFLKESQDVRANSRKFPDFLNKYQINTVIDELPTPIFTEQMGFMDSHEFYYPKSDWALVYFDQISVVYLRRIPAHRDIIHQFEYHFIKRGLPSNFGTEMKGLSDPIRAGFEAEFDQCLQRYSKNIYCLVGKATFMRARGNLEESLRLLLIAQEVDPKNTDMLFHLSQTYEKMGKTNEYKNVMRRFNRLAWKEGE